MKKSVITVVATTSPIWILLTIVFLVLALVFLLVLIPFLPRQSDDNIAFVSPPPIIASPSATVSISPGPTPVRGDTPGCDQIDQRLRSDFNIQVSGTACGDRQTTYSVFANLFASSRYARLVKNSGIVSVQFNPGGECGAQAYKRSFVLNLRGCNNERVIRYFLIHEMGHVIRNNNPIVRTYPLATLVSRDRNCYDQGYLKTYGRRAGIRKSESFAEAMALYYLNRHGGFGIGGTISNFKQECPNTYQEMRNNYFGGYEFN